MKKPFEKIRWKYYSEKTLLKFTMQKKLYVYKSIIKFFMYNVSTSHNIKITW
jgi:hypothetical protein